MQRVLKWARISAGALISIIILALAAVYLVSSGRINQTYSVAAVSVPVSSDAAVITRGKQVAVTRGCYDCHGEDLAGKVINDDFAIGRLVGANLTSGKGGIPDAYTNEDWARAIRHGVGADQKSLLIMPSHEFFPVSDQDIGALVSYIKSLPPVDNELPETRLGPLARILYLAGELPLLSAERVDHEARRAPAPPAGPTADYGAYLATSCSGCHGEGMSGGMIPGAPPGFPPATNITMDVETGLGAWTEADFFRALRQGRRPDGSEINPTMPWQNFRRMTDDEIQALWLYLQTVPPKPEGTR